MSESANARTTEPTFAEGLHGFASFCEACARDGKMDADDCQMVAFKLRDAAFVVDQLQKLRDELRGALKAAIRVADEARDEWDKAPSGMRAGKILIALSGNLRGYRADIDAIIKLAEGQQ